MRGAETGTSWRWGVSLSPDGSNRLVRTKEDIARIMGSGDEVRAAVGTPLGLLRGHPLVRAVRPLLGGALYLRTDANQERRDNLDNLPECIDS